MSSRCEAALVTCEDVHLAEPAARRGRPTMWGRKRRHSAPGSPADLDTFVRISRLRDVQTPVHDSARSRPRSREQAESRTPT